MAGRRLSIRGHPYRVENQIGHGLHSLVYGGRDLRTGRPVAIKIINFLHGSYSVKADTESRRQSYWKELQMLLYLQPLNPYIIRVLNHDHNDHQGIIVMERGETLRDTLMEHVVEGKPLSGALIHRYWAQMVEAIYYMHSLGIVHGDVKPENFIQVGADGSILRLIDMGISFHLPPNVTSRLKTAAGTPDYVSPEMVNSRVGFSSRSKCGYKADIWALGVILFEMAFGYRPLQSLRSNDAKLRYLGKLRGDIPIPNHPDRQLRDILKRCLRTDPHKRPSAEQVFNHPYVSGRLR